ncbi:CAP domain-containing protein [Nocardioides sp. LML1-1-1.1]|uniref:CAP domain-containing protein n=1 Tax=Nocardioides sp. LML1-1-1.1 TaxID=3135248 RepID=UPI003430AF57
MSRTLRSATAGLLTAAALVAAPTPVTTPPAQAQTVAAVSASYERAVLRQVNRMRLLRGIPALRTSRCVDRFAESRSRRMATYDAFRHLSGLRQVFARCGGRMVGENIAKGRRMPALRAVAGWMHSPSHRSLMLDGRFRQAGVGAWRDRDGTVYLSLVVRAP